ncbi:uncharacterized protein LOC144120150 [Amblyomma americanum]
MPSTRDVALQDTTTTTTWGGPHHGAERYLPKNGRTEAAVPDLGQPLMAAATDKMPPCAEIANSQHHGVAVPSSVPEAQSRQCNLDLLGMAEHVATPAEGKGDCAVTDGYTGEQPANDRPCTVLGMPPVSFALSLVLLTALVGAFIYTFFLFASGRVPPQRKNIVPRSANDTSVIL